jgi:hypothetical protein
MIAVMKAAIILVTVAKSKFGLANKLLTKIGIIMDPKETPAVAMDMATARFFSK